MSFAMNTLNVEYIEIDNTGDMNINHEEIIQSAKGLKNPVYDPNFLAKYRDQEELEEVKDRFYCILNKVSYSKYGTNTKNIDFISYNVVPQSFEQKSSQIWALKFDTHW